MYLKLEICVACREFLDFKYIFIDFFKTKQMNTYICTSEILKTHVYNQFFGTQYSFYLCWQVEDTKWILCCPKTGVECAY